MKEFLEKLAPYHFFNYLLPGVLFVFFVDYKIDQIDMILGLFLCYFIGLTISRIGSLFVEPILKSLKLVTFDEYDEFLDASKEDSKIEILSEANNMFRTICTLFLILFLLKMYEIIESAYPIILSWNQYILIGMLFVIFLFSYRKQSQYIGGRIRSISSKQKKADKQMKKQ